MLKSFKEYLSEYDDIQNQALRHSHEVIDHLIKTGIITDQAVINEARKKSRTTGLIKSVALGLKGKLSSISKTVNSSNNAMDKLNLMSRQLNLVGALSLLAVAAADDASGLISKASTLAAISN